MGNQYLFFNFIKNFFLKIMKFNKNVNFFSITKKKFTSIIIKLVRHNLISTRNNKNLIKNFIISYISKIKKFSGKYKNKRLYLMKECVKYYYKSFNKYSEMKKSEKKYT